MAELHGFKILNLKHDIDLVSKLKRPPRRVNRSESSFSVPFSWFQKTVLSRMGGSLVVRPCRRPKQQFQRVLTPRQPLGLGLVRAVRTGHLPLDHRQFLGLSLGDYPSEKDENVLAPAHRAPMRRIIMILPTTILPGKLGCQVGAMLCVFLHAGRLSRLSFEPFACFAVPPVSPHESAFCQTNPTSHPAGLVSFAVPNLPPGTRHFAKRSQLGFSSPACLLHR
jgi:hypothetical protein